MVDGVRRRQIGGRVVMFTEQLEPSKLGVTRCRGGECGRDSPLVVVVGVGVLSRRQA